VRSSRPPLLSASVGSAITAPPPTHHREVTLDLADLAGLPELTQIRIGFGGAIATLAPLAGPMGRRLRDFRIPGTKVGDGDLSPLQSLDPAADVLGPDD
jgi:hypothetical protein